MFGAVSTSWLGFITLYAELVEDYDAAKQVEYDTLIFLALHCWQPCRDLRCVRRPLTGSVLDIANSLRLQYRRRNWTGVKVRLRDR